MSCIFCKIVKGEIPCSTVYEDSEVIAFLDIKPAAKGHVLVVPKEHHENMVDMPAAVSATMILVAQLVAKAQHHAFSSTGTNFISNTGKDAGQIVFHAHLHVIPRYPDDGLEFKWDPREFSKAELAGHQHTLAGFLKK